MQCIAKCEIKAKERKTMQLSVWLLTDVLRQVFEKNTAGGLRRLKAAFILSFAKVYLMIRSLKFWSDQDQEPDRKKIWVRQTWQFKTCCSDWVNKASHRPHVIHPPLSWLNMTSPLLFEIVSNTSFSDVFSSSSSCSSPITTPHHVICTPGIRFIPRQQQH